MSDYRYGRDIIADAKHVLEHGDADEFIKNQRYMYEIIKEIEETRHLNVEDRICTKRIEDHWLKVIDYIENNR